MPDSAQTITISATLIGDVATEAIKNTAALKEMTQVIKEQGAQAQQAFVGMGQSLDQIAQKLGNHKEKVDEVKNSHDKWNEVLGKTHEGITNLGESITERLTYPVQQLTYALEGGTLGIAAFGIATYAGIQKASDQMAVFTGSASAGLAVTKQLMALRDPADLDTLTGSFETLSTIGGESQNTALGQTRALANAAAPYGNQAPQMLSSAASTFAQINAMQGVGIGQSQVQNLARLYPQIYGLLGQTTNETGSQVATGLQRGQQFVDPNLIAQLEALPQSKTGRADYLNTFSGQLDSMKTSLGDVLAGFETPLAQYLQRDAKDIDNWATGVEARFNTMGTRLFSEFSSGNMGAFQNTLGVILGSPNAARDITQIIELAEAFGRVLTGAVFPALRTVAGVAEPFLQFLADHKTTTEALVLAFGGMIILNKVATWALAARDAYALLAGAIRSTTVATEGLETAEGAGAAEGAAGAAGIAGIGAPGIALGVGAVGAAGLLAHLVNTGQDKTNTRGYLSGPSTKAIPSQSAISSELQGIQQYQQSIANNGTANNLQGITVNGDMNVTIPGAGNPEKVANSIPKGINAQVNANTARISRRTGKNIGS